MDFLVMRPIYRLNHICQVHSPSIEGNLANLAHFMRQDDDMATANIEIPDVEISNTWNIDLDLNTNMKILIIDDEPVNVALLDDMLRESGYTRIKSIMDPRLSLETCKAFEPDLI